MQKAIDPANLDMTIAPGENFYLYANGNWLKENTIPDEFSRYGTFDLLREENRKLVRDIIEEVSEKVTSVNDPIGSLVGGFYAGGMNIDRRNADGLKSLEAFFKEIESLESAEALKKYIVKAYKRSIPTLFYLYASPDRENSDLVIANLHQGGMGLSEVEYYLADDDRSREIRQKYHEYISRMFHLAGEDDSADSNAALILKMEIRLAGAGMTRLELRDPHLTYNKRTLQELNSEYPAFCWEEFFKELNIAFEPHVSVGQIKFFTEVSAMLSEISIEDWKVFLKWRLLNGTANRLSEVLEHTKFDFYGAYLSGKKAMQPLWKRVTAATEDALGEAIGRLFVIKYFPPEAKERMLKLTEHLRQALKEKIECLEWMSEATKTEALEKLQRMRVKVGYPEKWRSYEKLAFGKNESYLEMSLAASAFNQQYELEKIGKAPDPDEWHMTPQTVNAYYHPLLNEIVFPAGILQAPFFYKDADDAVNYGAIGVVIGHEMTHGFDDQGRKFDKKGNLNDWWSETDAKNFGERAKVLEDQFNKIKVTDDIYANGKLSLGENIADLGGVNIAFDAVKRAWAQHAPEKQIDGFTPEQRFFLAYAHIWANNIREKEMIRLTKEDVHSLGVNRVNGPLPNVEAFIKAFGIKETEKMYLPPQERASIW